MNEEKYFPDRPKQVTFCEIFETWLIVHAEKNKAASSVKKDKQVFKNYIKPFFGENNLPKLRTADFDKFIDGLVKNTKLSNNSINKILQIVRSVINFAVCRRYILYSPMSAIKMLPVYEQPFDYWSFDEASQFLSFVNEKYLGEERWPYVLYLLMLSTGIRLGEARAIEWRNVLFDQNLIRICASYDATTRKVKQTTKSRKIRYVPLDDNLKMELIHQRSKNEDTKYIFESVNGLTRDMDNFRHRHYHRDVNGSEVRRIRMHDFRHTFASHYMMNGGNLHDLQMILGHSELKVTMRYAHLSPGHIASKAGIVFYDTELLKPSRKVISLQPTESHNIFTTSENKKPSAKTGLSV